MLALEREGAATASLRAFAIRLITSVHLFTNHRLCRWLVNVTSASNVTISSNGTLYAEVYANQSNVTVSGAGIVAGSIIGKTITDSGGAALY